MNLNELDKIDQLVLCILNDPDVELGNDGDKYWAYLEAKYGMGVLDMVVPTVKQFEAILNEKHKRKVKLRRTA